MNQPPPKWSAIATGAGASNSACHNWFLNRVKPHSRNPGRAEQVRRIIAERGAPPRRRSRQ